MNLLLLPVAVLCALAVTRSTVLAFDSPSAAQVRACFAAQHCDTAHRSYIEVIRSYTDRVHRLTAETARTPGQPHAGVRGLCGDYASVTACVTRFERLCRSQLQPADLASRVQPWRTEGQPRVEQLCAAQGHSLTAHHGTTATTTTTTTEATVSTIPPTEAATAPPAATTVKILVTSVKSTGQVNQANLAIFAFVLLFSGLFGLPQI